MWIVIDEPGKKGHARTTQFKRQWMATCVSIDNLDDSIHFTNLKGENCDILQNTLKMIKRHRVIVAKYQQISPIRRQNHHSLGTNSESCDTWEGRTKWSARWPRYVRGLKAIRYVSSPDVAWQDILLSLLGGANDERPLHIINNSSILTLSKELF